MTRTTKRDTPQEAQFPLSGIAKCVPERHTVAMSRPKQDAPSHFGDLIAAAIKRGMAQFGMSGRGLARRLGKSEGYVRDRLNGTYEFSITDVERFALFIGMNPEDFVGAIDRDALAPELPERGTGHQAEARTLGEILGGRTPASRREHHADGDDDAHSPGGAASPAPEHAEIPSLDSARERRIRATRSYAAERRPSPREDPPRAE